MGEVKGCSFHIARRRTPHYIETPASPFQPRACPRAQASSRPSSPKVLGCEFGAVENHREPHLIITWNFSCSIFRSPKDTRKQPVTKNLLADSAHPMKGDPTWPTISICGSVGCSMECASVTLAKVRGFSTKLQEQLRSWTCRFVMFLGDACSANPTPAIVLIGVPFWNY